MIRHGTFNSNKVFEITPDNLVQMKPFKRVRGHKKFQAPSTSIIIEVLDNEIGMIVGKNVTESQLKKLHAFSVNQNKPLKLITLEGMGNLYLIDKILQLNEVLTG